MGQPGCQYPLWYIKQTLQPFVQALRFNTKDRLQGLKANRLWFLVGHVPSWCFSILFPSSSLINNALRQTIITTSWFSWIREAFPGFRQCNCPLEVLYWQIARAVGSGQILRWKWELFIPFSNDHLTSWRCDQCWRRLNTGKVCFGGIACLLAFASWPCPK